MEDVVEILQAYKNKDDTVKIRIANYGYKLNNIEVVGHLMLNRFKDGSLDRDKKETVEYEETFYSINEFIKAYMKDWKEFNGNNVYDDDDDFEIEVKVSRQGRFTQYIPLTKLIKKKKQKIDVASSNLMNMNVHIKDKASSSCDVLSKPNDIKIGMKIIIDDVVYTVLKTIDCMIDQIWMWEVKASSETKMLSCIQEKWSLNYQPISSMILCDEKYDAWLTAFEQSKKLLPDKKYHAMVIEHLIKCVEELEQARTSTF